VTRPHVIEYTDAARADLLAITDYVGDAAGPQIAEQLVERIIAAVESPSIRPKRQRVRHELGVDIRAFGARKYLISYRVARGRVLIVRILHGARDITSKLFETE
jgi:toxin ParE1/3/4